MVWSGVVQAEFTGELRSRSTKRSFFYSPKASGFRDLLFHSKDRFICESPYLNITSIWGNEMKTKVMATLLCCMLLTTSLMLATASEKMMTTNAGTHHIQPLSVDVPVWHVGDFWTYKVDNVSVNFQENNQTIYLTVSIDQLPLTVERATADSYALSFSTKANGHAIIDVDAGDGPINMVVDFTNVQLSGSIMIEKTQLGIQSIDATLHGLFRLNIIEQPYTNLSFHHVPIPITMNVTIAFSNPVSILAFPMDTGKSWNLSATDFTINGEIHSVWLNIIHFANAIMGFFGNSFLSPEIETLLPVVTIRDALTMFGIGNAFSIPEVPGIFTSGSTMETITVPAGTYDAYNISIVEGIGSIFYAPVAGNVVKIGGNFQGVIPFIQNIKMELIATNYQG